MARRGAPRQGRAVILDEILAKKEEEISRLRGTPCETRFAPRGIAAAELLRSQGMPLRLVAEIKRKSPSAGALSTKLTPVERALRYADGGASMISVLCDEPFFDGGWDHVEAVRSAIGDRRVAILAKEFVLDERQIAEAAARGADAVLLIARIVPPERLAELHRVAEALGLEPLVEVVTQDELAAAIDAGAKIIGVNARDLDTLAMDPARARAVIDAIPDDRVAVHLSGLKTPADVEAVARSRADAALVGEALMREDDPAALLGKFSAATRVA
jgi:indole-3-glycerol phosphate synthase